jgi:hypothetical protein
VINESKYRLFGVKISNVKVHKITGAVINGAASATIVFWYCESLPAVYIICT